MNLAIEIDRLYQLPLDDFTAARNALAATLKAEGEQEAAARMKALEKPSASAWAVNHFYWKTRRDYDTLLEAGARLRRAQERSLKGGSAADLRAASEAKERAVNAALKVVMALLERASGALSPAVRQRVATTLEAIAIQGGMGTVAPGRLVDDLPLPGFAALAALTHARFTLRDALAASRSPSAPAVTASGTRPRARAGDTERAKTERLATERAKAERASEAALARASEVERRARIDRGRAGLAAAESEARAARENAARAAAAERDATAKADAARQAVEETKVRLADAMARATRAVEEQRTAKRRAAETDAALEQAGEAVAAAPPALHRALGLYG